MYASRTTRPPIETKTVHQRTTNVILSREEAHAALIRAAIEKAGITDPNASCSVRVYETAEDYDGYSEIHYEATITEDLSQPQKKAPPLPKTVTVPLIPTTKMHEAGLDITERKLAPSWTALNVYHAMIAAAPKTEPAQPPADEAPTDPDAFRLGKAMPTLSGPAADQYVKTIALSDYAKGYEDPPALSDPNPINEIYTKAKTGRAYPSYQDVIDHRETKAMLSPPSMGVPPLFEKTKPDESVWDGVVPRYPNNT